MYNLSKAKQTLYWIIAALTALLILYPIIAEAEKENEPQLIINYAQFHKPLNKTPYGPERLAPKLNRPLPKKASAPKANKRPNPPKASGQRDYGSGEVQDLIRKYSQQYGINPATPLCIAKKESDFNPLSANKRSSARGVFQYLSGTWAGTDEGKAGLSVLNADANVRAAVKYMAIHKSTKPWTVRAKCPPLSFL